MSSWVQPEELVLHASDIRCRIKPAKEVLDPSVIGLQVHDNMDTLDVLYYANAEGLTSLQSWAFIDTCDLYRPADESGSAHPDVNWYAQMKTDGHPLTGTWYVIQGPPRDYKWGFNTSIVLMKKATAPPGVSVA